MKDKNSSYGKSTNPIEKVQPRSFVVFRLLGPVGYSNELVLRD